MKTLTTIVLAVFFAINLQAQHTANIDFFVGTWRYENPQTGEEFILKLRKISHLLMPSDPFPTEYVVGAYTFKRNGQIVTDCMDKFDSDVHPVRATNSTLRPSTVNPNRLRMSVSDYGKRAPNGSVKTTGDNNELLIVSATEPHQIRWILREDRGVRAIFEGEEDGIHPLGFSIPTDIILTRVMPQSEVTISANSPAGGTVTGGGTFPVGSQVTISATPSPNFRFVSWTKGNTSINTPSHTFILNDNAVNFTANFAPINPCGQAAFLSAHTAFRHHMMFLGSKVFNGKEHFVTFRPNLAVPTDDLSYALSMHQGTAGEHLVDFPMPSEPIGGIANSSFWREESLCVFTKAEISEMAGLLYAGVVADPATFFMALVTPHGTAYLLMVEDLVRFERSMFNFYFFIGRSRQEVYYSDISTLIYFGVLPENNGQNIDILLMYLKVMGGLGLAVFMTECPDFSHWIRLCLETASIGQCP